MPWNWTKRFPSLWFGTGRKQAIMCPEAPSAVLLQISTLVRVDLIYTISDYVSYVIQLQFWHTFVCEVFQILATVMFWSDEVWQFMSLGMKYTRSWSEYKQAIHQPVQTNQPNMQ